MGLFAFGHEKQSKQNIPDGLQSVQGCFGLGAITGFAFPNKKQPV
jgi:hypothetical protein